MASDPKVQGLRAPKSLQNTRVKKSAGFISWGVVVLVLGQVLFDSGRQSVLNAAIDDYQRNDGGGGSNLMVVGGLITAVGVALLVNGLVRLARNVDYTAQTLAEAQGRREARN